MIHDGQREHPRVLECTTHQFVALDAMAIIRDGHHPGFLEASNGGEFLARDALGDGAGHEDIDRTTLGGAVLDQGHRSRTVDGR